MSKNKQKLVIIDANALIHRAFHALPPLTNKQGQMTNAVYGFTAILLKVIKDLKPDFLAAAFDLPGKTFRHEEYNDYKATRVKAPDELYEQIPLVKKVLSVFNILIYEKEGFEADDVIGTIANLKSVDRPDIQTIIVTGDQDTFQLIDDNTTVLTPHKGLGETILYDEKLIKEKFEGLKPDQLVDYKALKGDPSDNIPGVKGIGHKGAINLLNNFKTLDNLYQNISSDKISDRYRQLLKQRENQATLSKKLAKIITNLNIGFRLEDCRFKGFDKIRVVELFQELNFKRLLSQISSMDKKVALGGQAGLFDEPMAKEEKKDPSKIKNYKLIDNNTKFKDFYNELKQQKAVALDTEASGIDPFRAELLGISLAWQKNRAYYLPLPIIKSHLKLIADFLDNQRIKKVGHNIKYDLEIINNFGLKFQGIIFDTMIASYLLNPENRQHNLSALAFSELGYEMQPIEELIGRGKDQISMAEVEIKKVAWYAAEDADVTWQLYQKLEAQLRKENIFGLLKKIDLPLVEVLAEMEAEGVKIDIDFLDKLSQKLGRQISKVEDEIYRLAGTNFNVASPLQLKEILFDRLNISTQGLNKTKTGISTAARELDKLQGQHEIIDLIIEFRELSKLKNTYSDALPKLVNPKTGRVHTSFNQTVTATGRLSSSDPNLQNIPIRTEIGREIRKAFIAESGYKILKADYSQIELRIVASLANDKKMLKVFEDRGDIHSTTAAFINNIKVKDVSREQRRQAKEVNFGVLYGMGAWGLAERTGISRERAKDFIDKYFLAYKDVKKYIDQTIINAREFGYVETFYGRRRYLSEIISNIQQVRAGAERMAINMPIQGTAADLIKLAMIEIHKNLPKISKKTKMILQVHDELVFEVPQSEVKEVAKFVRNSMNKVYQLRAPIETEVSVGDNWGETEVISNF